MRPPAPHRLDMRVNLKVRKCSGWLRLQVLLRSQDGYVVVRFSLRNNDLLFAQHITLHQSDDSPTGRAVGHANAAEIYRRTGTPTEGEQTVLEFWLAEGEGVSYDLYGRLGVMVKADGFHLFEEEEGTRHS